VQVARAIVVMRAAGRSLSFDPNLRPTLWASQALMRETLNALAVQCDWVLPGVEEGYVLTGSRDPAAIARFYRERGVERVVVKLGPQGAYYDDRDAGCDHVSAFPVAKVVDTVGAGDGFAVGVLSALLAGRGVADAARRGAWIGARAVQVIGDTEGLPTRAQLEEAGL
jgi:2-dehydro-3-deoxygluconokinase